MSAQVELVGLGTRPGAVSDSRQRSRGSRGSRGASDAELLFDAPGPRGRRRIRVASVLVTVLLAGLVALALYRASQEGQLAYPRWRYFLGRSTLLFLLQALGQTLLAAGAGAVVSFPLGILLGWARLSRRRLVSTPVGLWIDAMRAVPMLLLIYFFLLAVPSMTGHTLPPLWMLVIPIIMCTSATTAEVFRAGILALDTGQTEAAAALGLGPGQTMRLVLAPQALRLMLPTLVTQMVTILKDTSLGYVVAYNELMFAGRRLETFTRSEHGLDIYLQTYVVIAVLYLLMNWGLSALARSVEERTR